MYLLRKIKAIIKECKLIRNLFYGCGLFVFEYIANHIVNHIPNAYFRYLFYRYVLRIEISSKAYLHMGIYIYPKMNIMKIGDNTVINADCILDRRSGLYIGENVNISRDVAIYTGGHEIDSIVFSYFGKSVHINDLVWIGTRAMIMPGVTVGKGAVILPGAIVTHDCDAFGIYGGIPAKKIGERSRSIDYTLEWRSYFL